MRIADIDFILVPDWHARPTVSEPHGDHWISRWQRNLASAEWLGGSPDKRPETQAKTLIAQASGKRPTMAVTHGGGIDVLLHAADALDGTPVVGAFIVAPVASPSAVAAAKSSLPLTVSSVLVAPDDHPEFSADEAQRLAGLLGSHFVPAGPAGRIDAATGQGPWPEGLMRLGWLLKQLTRH